MSRQALGIGVRRDEKNARASSRPGVFSAIIALLMTNRAVFLLSLAAFASAASLRATDTLLPLLAAEFSVTTGGAAMSLFALCLFTGQSTGVWIAGKVVDAYGTEPVFAAVSLGLALLGWNFRRRLKIQAQSARA